MRRRFRTIGILFLIVFALGLAGWTYEFIRVIHFRYECNRIKKPDPDRVPWLVRRLKDYNPFMREEAVRKLQRMGAASQAAIPELIQALDDPSTIVRCIALWTLVRIDRVDDVQMAKFIAAMGDPERDVQIISILAVRVNAKNANAKDAIPKLIECLDDPLLAGSAAEALGEIGPAANCAIQKMIATMPSSSLWGLREYIVAFEKLGAASKPAVSRLQPLTQDPDPLISQAATSAVQTITAATP